MLFLNPKPLNLLDLKIYSGNRPNRKPLCKFGLLFAVYQIRH